MPERDDFSERVKRVLGDRVGWRCSHPDCRAFTTGPHTEVDKRVSVGMAAHITAATPGGPRYDPRLTPEERTSADNGIWMCQTHGTLIDRDAERYLEALLREWKGLAEKRAEAELGKSPSAATQLGTIPEQHDATRPRIRLSTSDHKAVAPVSTKAWMSGLHYPLFDVRNTGEEEAFDVLVTIHVMREVTVVSRRIDHLQAGGEKTIMHRDLRYVYDGKRTQGVNLWMYIVTANMGKQKVELPVPARITYRDRNDRHYLTQYDVANEGCTFLRDEE